MLVIINSGLVIIYVPVADATAHWNSRYQDIRHRQALCTSTTDTNLTCARSELIILLCLSISNVTYNGICTVFRMTFKYNILNVYFCFKA
jgi:hypothetical protein